MFKGSFTALVTPFRAGKNGTAGMVDEKKFAELIEFQIKNGTDGIVPAGCTGEAATLTHKEQGRLVSLACEIVDKRVPVIGGAGSNNTEEAIMLTRFAKKAGCDAALSITPYYNKPTPEGQYRHYAAIAKKVEIPIVVYNVPSRTGISIKPQTVARLSKIDNIVAIKEASGSIDQTSEILSLCDITVLSGDDSLTLPMMAVGAKGVISVVSNIIPREVHDMVLGFLEGDFERARQLHYRILPLCKAMFIETNPIPIKTSMRLLRRLNGKLRLPLCEMQKENEGKLRKSLKDYGLL
ncbi:MAG: 4-hydroxy-tetrahydrodipicolinate synthase [Omnitrophica bacterium RBG_13_46_9]|nr:MAG: 4-hydroxy-tetrahydrodipicolinate synthase [Omnitrophica bacterium RBG_13_46_9]